MLKRPLGATAHPRHTASSTQKRAEQNQITAFLAFYSSSETGSRFIQTPHAGSYFAMKRLVSFGVDLIPFRTGSLQPKKRLTKALFFYRMKIKTRLQDKLMPDEKLSKTIGRRGFSRSGGTLGGSALQKRRKKPQGMPITLNQIHLP